MFKKFWLLSWQPFVTHQVKLSHIITISLIQVVFFKIEIALQVGRTQGEGRHNEEGEIFFRCTTQLCRQFLIYEKKKRKKRKNLRQVLKLLGHFWKAFQLSPSKIILFLTFELLKNQADTIPQGQPQLNCGGEGNLKNTFKISRVADKNS